MKRNYFIAIAMGFCLMAATFTSCSKDDAPGSEVTEDTFSFIEPYHGTTSDEATVVDYMKNIKDYHLESRDVLMESTGTFQLIYANSSVAMMYMFTQNRLMSSAVYEEGKHYAAVQKFLDGKYTFINESPGIRAYTTSDKKQHIQLLKDSGKQGFLSVIYTFVKPD